MKGMKLVFFVMFASILVASLWAKIPIIKDSVHSILDPSFGALLNWNLHLGFIIIAFLFALITTLLQKYATDQAALKQIKEEQKLIQEEVKKFREHPEKAIELNKKSMDLAFKAMPLSMRPVIFTSIPFVLFLRWFTDYFSLYTEAKIFGIFSIHGSFLFPGWIWAYIITTIFFSSIFRKYLKVH